MKTIYKEAIRYFRKNPAELAQAWRTPLQHPHGGLFSFCSPDRHSHLIPGAGRIGCPLMVASRPEYVAWTPSLTERCRQEIPGHVEQLTDRSLNALGELQDDMDLTIRNPDWLRKSRYACYPGSAGVILIGLALGEADEDEPDEEEI